VVLSNRTEHPLNWEFAAPRRIDAAGGAHAATVRRFLFGFRIHDGERVFQVAKQEITKMETPKPLSAQVTRQSAPSFILPPLLRARFPRGAFKTFLLYMGLATTVAGALCAAQHVDAAADPDSAARADWRTFMVHHPMPVGGCFHSSYPSIVWERVECDPRPPRVHPTHVRPTGNQTQATSNAHD
jgi:hypothetical protein